MRDQVTGSGGHTVPQHVWVCVTGRWHERYPGVLLEWRRRPDDTWEALASYVIGGGNHAWEVRQGWIQAAHLRRRE